MLSRLLIFSLILLLGSCTTIRFVDAMPIAGETVADLPNNWSGTYYSPRFFNLTNEKGFVVEKTELVQDAGSLKLYRTSLLMASEEQLQALGVEEKVDPSTFLFKGDKVGFKSGDDTHYFDLETHEVLEEMELWQRFDLNEGLHHIEDDEPKAFVMKKYKGAYYLNIAAEEGFEVMRLNKSNRTLQIDMISLANVPEDYKAQLEKKYAAHLALVKKDVGESLVLELDDDAFFQVLEDEKQYIPTITWHKQRGKSSAAIWFALGSILLALLVVAGARRRGLAKAKRSYETKT